MSTSVPPPPPVANAPKPPVVLPGSGNNIIVNPLQVCSISHQTIDLSHFVARKPCSRLHKKRWKRIRWHCCRLSGRKNDWCSVFEVCFLESRQLLWFQLICCCSLKYHRLHPEYIYGRIEQLGSHAYNLRILLILCDVVSCFLLCPSRDLYTTSRRVNTEILSANLQRWVSYLSVSDLNAYVLP